ncbi:MAG: ATP-dependent zinc metalloprotease FtsH [Chloroflexi bacterium]|nr:ATP-dependent zinc metalloprotease FtsH [Chloroflexota bacterium]
MREGNEMDEKKEQKGRRRLPPWLILGFALIAVLLFVPMLRGGSGEETEEVSLQTFAQEVEAAEAERIVVKGDKLTLERQDGTEIESRKEEGISAIETLQRLGVSDEALQAVEIEVQKEGTNIVSILVSLAPLLFFVVIGFFIFRQLRGAGGIFGFGKSKPRVTGVDGQRPNVTFADVAGVETAKLELQEVVEFLKFPAKFTRLGAHVPKGVLLVGPPGTGKTLLARAVAGEAGVPFLSISASEFVEMFVGAGASRVRDLFEKAKAAAPSIIFIDEIDAVGRRRGVGLGGGNDEREQTLNQILVEMDGFETGTNVIVIAATNREDVLDAALLRPGRFDRRVVVDRPDIEGREAILRVHSQGKPLAQGVELADIAKLTAGFTGADLENLMNEAAILAARKGVLAIGSTELDEAFERIVAGPERSKNLLSPEERRVVAYHEAGHALVMESMPNADPVHKVSIVSRGHALGYTMPLPERDRVLRSKEALEEEIAGLMGGRAVEELLCGSITTGAANDLERATALARAMVTQYGMSDELGLRIFAAGETSLPSWPPQQRDYAEGTALRIDAEIKGILDRAHDKAKAVLRERWATVARLAGALLEQETLERPDIERLLAENDPGTEVPCEEEVTA